MAILSKIKTAPVRTFNWFKTRVVNIIEDYKRVSIETFEAAQQKPVKYITRSSLTILGLYSYLNRPDLENYKNQLHSQNLKMIGFSAVRNPIANERIQEQLLLVERNLVFLDNYLIFCLIRKSNFSRDCLISEAISERTSFRWYNPVNYFLNFPRFLESIQDVGICNNFLALEYSLGRYPDSDLTDLGKDPMVAMQERKLEIQRIQMGLPRVSYSSSAAAANKKTNEEQSIINKISEFSSQTRDVICRKYDIETDVILPEDKQRDWDITEDDY